MGVAVKKVRGGDSVGVCGFAQSLSHVGNPAMLPTHTCMLPTNALIPHCHTAFFRLPLLPAVMQWPLNVAATSNVGVSSIKHLPSTLCLCKSACLLPTVPLFGQCALNPRSSESVSTSRAPMHAVLSACVGPSL
jgi:hypothetical protein